MRRPLAGHVHSVGRVLSNLEPFFGLQVKKRESVRVVVHVDSVKYLVVLHRTRLGNLQRSTVSDPLKRGEREDSSSLKC